MSEHHEGAGGPSFPNGHSNRPPQIDRSQEKEGINPADVGRNTAMDVHHSRINHRTPPIAMAAYSVHRPEARQNPPILTPHPGYGFHPHLQQGHNGLVNHNMPHQGPINPYQVSPTPVVEAIGAMGGGDTDIPQNQAYQNGQVAVYSHQRNAANMENAVSSEASWAASARSLEELRWRESHRNIPARGEVA